MLDSRDLSPRENQIAESYAAGCSYQEIASDLHIAPSTVRTHLATIYRKLEVSSKVELAARLGGSAAARSTDVDHAAIISELALSLEEALSREKALTEVLRIIGASQGDLSQVMPAILGYALDLCDAEFGILFEYRQNKRYLASFTLGIPPAFKAWLDDNGTFVVGDQTGLGRLTTRQNVIHIIDVKSEAIYRTDDPLRFATADLGGARSFVAIPMVAAGRLVGAFTIYRQSVRPFSDEALRLAQIFAAQSVIALENARLLGGAKPGSNS
ncbi:LuxR C-terminal-related transcriptional regulator [Pontivivens insulae]|uniref:Transcriptional regulatory protein UhpA n=1 Tax=Pontivivens insulae TaxID=1639689 RepID=A0A2R8AE80_9RHOB|nr:LuxR C-terminal-related transcriptional regulator [Pontivivens insulae]RED14441.1 GAF domain-containing protein [Pontivivens insulae]SPF30519.1 Transcriptional regulatory protein UhpA [Pontivivens insulae]